MRGGTGCNPDRPRADQALVTRSPSLHVEGVAQQWTQSGAHAGRSSDPPAHSSGHGHGHGGNGGTGGKPVKGGHSHGGHGHSHGALSSPTRVLGVTLCLTLGYAVVEAAMGVFTGSLSLMADAGHMITDSG